MSPIPLSADSVIGQAGKQARAYRRWLGNTGPPARWSMRYASENEHDGKYKWGASLVSGRDGNCCCASKIPALCGSCSFDSDCRDFHWDRLLQSRPGRMYNPCDGSPKGVHGAVHILHTLLSDLRKDRTKAGQFAARILTALGIAAQDEFCEAMEAGFAHALWRATDGRAKKMQGC